MLYALIQRSAWKVYSPKFGCRILHSPGPNRPGLPRSPHAIGPTPMHLVAPMYRYAL